MNIPFLSIILFTLFISSHVHSKEFKEVKNISELELSLSADFEPLTTVANCVNVESGRFFQARKDILTNTIDPLSLTHFYDSEQYVQSFMGLGFGSEYAFFATEVQETSRHFNILFGAREGFWLPFRKTFYNSPGDEFAIDPRIFNKGYTNTNGKEISGKTNVVNQKVIPIRNNKTLTWQVRLGDGTIRNYTSYLKLHPSAISHMNIPTKHAYLLTEEIKPNGNKIEFEYKLEENKLVKPRIQKIRTRNRDGHTINYLEFSYSSVDGICIVRSSCGHTVRYFEPLTTINNLDGIQKRILYNINSSQCGSVDFSYNNSHFKPSVISVKKQGVDLKLNYSKGLKSITESIGPNGEDVLTNLFHYDKGYTRALNVLGHATDYYFDANKRLVRLDYLDNGSISKQECFEWSKKEGQEGWLSSKSIQINNQINYLQKYKYDKRGNPTKKILLGNISGLKTSQFEYQNRYQTDCFEINYIYSTDGFNNLLSELHPQGLLKSYEYLSNTNLCIKELTSYSGYIQERLFRFYDVNGQISKIIEDDGISDDANNLSNVTYRKTTVIFSEPNASLVSYGKPKNIYEHYYDPFEGHDVFLRRCEFIYDIRGYEIAKRFHNSANTFCYETTSHRNEKGLVVQESDPLGVITTYNYDANDNLTFAEKQGSGKKTFYSYDKRNNLIAKVETLDSGESFLNHYTYDYLNNLISEIDSFNNQTGYAYDRFNRQISCSKPNVKDILGNVTTPTTRKSYNILGQVESETDENNLTTKYERNIFGNVTKVLYPNGTCERKTYSTNGWLQQYWKADNTSIYYHYDLKGKVVKEQYLDAQGTKICSKEFGYKGSLLKFFKDEMGVVTTFEHDGAGRKISQTTQNKIDYFVYDDFDRVIQEIHVLDANQSQIISYTYDFLDRIVSKEHLNKNGQLFSKETYAYDINGNRIRKDVYQSDSVIASYQSFFDARGNLLKKINPLLSTTTISYDFYHINDLNQRVLKTTAVDALNRSYIDTKDALFRTIKSEIYDNGKLCSSKEYFYDGISRQTGEKALALSEGAFIREYKIEKRYNNANLLESITEYPSGKSTRYEYDLTGQLIKKIKPDDIIIFYSYDALGRLITQQSSDNSIHYQFSYDLHDNPVVIKDLIQNTTQTRVYDLSSRLIEEFLSPEVHVKYSYDNLNRLSSFTLPDQSFIKYIYDAFNLKKLQRFSSQEELLYECACDEHDWKGRILKEVSPAGGTTYIYDLLGRTIGTETYFWKSYLEEFDAVGNLLKIKQTDPTGLFVEEYAYDSLNQLTKESSKNAFSLDSLGNILKKNQLTLKINELNQVEDDNQSKYEYDLNGNLTYQEQPKTYYSYDALNRLTSYSTEKDKIEFIYDAFDRCLSIKNNSQQKNLIYQYDQEIGSSESGKLNEIKVGDAISEKVFAIELNGKTYFPLQDHRNNICALRGLSGSLVNWSRYSAYGDIITNGDTSIVSPWRFSNRRAIEGLVQFTHRYYNSNLMRWLNPDPIGFEDGINLYSYNHNNPFKYFDRDGQFAAALPIVAIAFGVGEAAITIATIKSVVTAVVVAAATYSVFEGVKKLDCQLNSSTETEEKIQEKKKSKPKSTVPDRFAPDNLEEQLTIEEAKAGAGDEIRKLPINDPRYPKEEWAKMQHVHEKSDGKKITVHYWEERTSQDRHGFKIKPAKGEK